MCISLFVSKMVRPNTQEIYARYGPNNGEEASRRMKTEYEKDGRSRRSRRQKKTDEKEANKRKG